MRQEYRIVTRHAETRASTRLFAARMPQVVESQRPALLSLWEYPA